MEIVESLYNHALAMNEEAFEAGLYDTAYHFLMGAYYCAKQLKSSQPLQKVRQRAIEQLAWIDEYHPEYDHSTRSSSDHGLGYSIFSNLANQAGAMLTIREGNHRHGVIGRKMEDLTSE